MTKGTLVCHGMGWKLLPHRTNLEMLATELGLMWDLAPGWRLRPPPLPPGHGSGAWGGWQGSEELRSLWDLSLHLTPFLRVSPVESWAGRHLMDEAR